MIAKLLALGAEQVSLASHLIFPPKLGKFSSKCLELTRIFVFDNHVTPCAQPPVNYLAPECFSDSKECDSYSDIFSVGVLIYSIFNNGRSLIDGKSNGENLKNNISKLKSLPPSILARIPESLKEDIKLCLNLKPELRPDAMQLAKIGYLIDDNVKYLHQLETMCQFDGSQKVQFLKMLYAKLDHFSQKILTRKILPFIGEELNAVEMIPVVLPILLYIGEKMDANSFTDQLLPILSPVFSVQTPYRVPALLMQKMPMFLSKSSPTDIRTLIVPMMYASLESNIILLQEACLNVLPNVVQLMDSTTVKNQFLPKILLLAAE
uniref:Protein kinase domain-containing protein n=1 Tax=Romanomermis culicivorax TaxID=13658 RepID=A0A915J014_ROMCU